MVWHNAVTSEVFALNNLLTALLLWLLLEFSKVIATEGRDGDSALQGTHLAYAGAFVCGLGWTNQHTIVLFQGPIVLFVLWRMRGAIRRRPIVLTWLGVSFLFGLAPCAYMPWSHLMASTTYSWGTC